MRHDDDDYGLPHIDVVVPDDARELDEDVAQWRREEKVRLRKARWAKLTKPFKGWGLALPITVLVLLVAILSGTLMTLFGPRVPQPTTPAQPLVRPSAGVGSVDGLLPSAEVTVNGAPLHTTRLRPALIAIIPPDCGCDSALRAFDEITETSAVRFYLLADRRTGGESVKKAHEELWKISGRVADSQAAIVDDSTNLLARTYQARGLTVLVVKANGTVGRIMLDVRTPPDPAQIRF
ncbi:hypothetical protein LO762_13705 [Actinocorallia sp. API 0066]|uniref:hypothetical protein n=1 Tax=Actinocorallia sp. API 0066 TaxID=2896846 RepID=UPI001E43566E|nr:hypothetical protein [Actinocorallia sp. API 0066]MCD0450239.1 hypothetical protein [Actinocorallia sp. API 0066]